MFYEIEASSDAVCGVSDHSAIRQRIVTTLQEVECNPPTANDNN